MEPPSAASFGHRARGQNSVGPAFVRFMRSKSALRALGRTMVSGSSSSTWSGGAVVVSVRATETLGANLNPRLLSLSAKGQKLSRPLFSISVWMLHRVVANAVLAGGEVVGPSDLRSPS